MGAQKELLLIKRKIYGIIISRKKENVKRTAIIIWQKSPVLQKIYNDEKGVEILENLKTIAVFICASQNTPAPRLTIFI